MAQKERVILVCDRHGESCPNPDTIKTDIQIGFRGKRRKIDLCEPEEQQLADFIEPYIAAGRDDSKLSTEDTKPKRGQASADKKANAEQLDQIRRWARENGFNVADRGRIRAEIQDAFRKAQAQNSAGQPEQPTGATLAEDAAQVGGVPQPTFSAAAV